MAQPQSGRRILVVDDSSFVRRQLSSCLIEAGFEVLEAENGQLGLEVAQNETFELIIADLHMPAMDGLTMIEEIHKLDQHKNTPAVALTTESSRKWLAQGRRVGVSAWFVKPFSEPLLLKAVQSVLDRAQSRSA